MRSDCLKTVEEKNNKKDNMAGREIIWRNQSGGGDTVTKPAIRAGKWKHVSKLDECSTEIQESLIKREFYSQKESSNFLISFLLYRKYLCH